MKNIFRPASSAYRGGEAAKYHQSRSADSIWARENQAVQPALARLLPNGGTVLDLAAGTGRWLETYKELNARPTLLDGSEDMLLQAVARAAKLGVTVTTILSDIEDIRELPPADVLVATRIFNWISLSKVERVLSMGAAAGIGTFVFTVRQFHRAASRGHQWQSLLHWQSKNLAVLVGLRKKALYRLHRDTSFSFMLDRLGLVISEATTIERVRAETYSVLVVTAR